MKLLSISNMAIFPVKRTTLLHGKSFLVPSTPSIHYLGFEEVTGIDLVRRGCWAHRWASNVVIAGHSDHVIWCHVYVIHSIHDLSP